MKAVMNGIGAALFFVVRFVANRWRAIVRWFGRISPEVFVIAAVVGAILAVLAGEYTFALLVFGAGGLSWFSFWMARRS